MFEDIKTSKLPSRSPISFYSQGSVENPLFVHIYCKINPSCPGYTVYVLPGLCRELATPVPTKQYLAQGLSAGAVAPFACKAPSLPTG